MARQPSWQDEYWPLLLQAYLKRPRGLKPAYSRAMVDLALELHVHPEMLHRQMVRLETLDSPRLQQLWNQYASRPRRLSRAVALLRRMSGFGNQEAFYAGVEVNESWERLFKPVDGGSGEQALTPAKLIMILDLYFRLVPDTMVSTTPEVVELSRLIRSTPAEVVEAMEVFRFCDPVLSHEDMMIHPLLTPCMRVWRQYGGPSPEKVSAMASQLIAYWT